MAQNSVDNSLFTALAQGRSLTGSDKAMLPHHVDVKTEIIAGVYCYWFSPLEADNENVVIYLHGGGYALGSIRSHKAMVRQVAKSANTRTVCVDYSLAPENPYPPPPPVWPKVYQEVVRSNKRFRIFLLATVQGVALSFQRSAGCNRRTFSSPVALYSFRH